MKATYRRSLETRKGALERVLARFEALGPSTDHPSDLDDFGCAKDYLLGWIDRIDTELQGETA